MPPRNTNGPHIYVQICMYGWTMVIRIARSILTQEGGSNVLHLHSGYMQYLVPVHREWVVECSTRACQNITGFVLQTVLYSLNCIIHEHSSMHAHYSSSPQGSTSAPTKPRIVSYPPATGFFLPLHGFLSIKFCGKLLDRTTVRRWTSPRPRCR